jgi:hypothetical protein
MIMTYPAWRISYWHVVFGWPCSGFLTNATSRRIW